MESGDKPKGNRKRSGGAWTEHRGLDRQSQIADERTKRAESISKNEGELVNKIGGRKERIAALGIGVGSIVKIILPEAVKEAVVLGFDETGRKFKELPKEHAKEIFISDETGRIWVSGLDPIHKDNPRLCDPFDIELES